MKYIKRRIRPFWLQMFLLFIFLLPVAVGGIFYDYIDEVRVSKVRFKNEQVQVEKQITEAIKILDSGQKFVEKTVDTELKNDFKIFVEAYKEASGDPSKIDLPAVRQILGTNKDLYIINKSGIIQYSTRKEDIGIDFNNWGMGAFINSVRMGYSFHSGRIDPAFVSGVIRKYAYFPAPDHEYTLEIGIDVEGQKDNLNSSTMLEIAERLKKAYPDVQSIRLFNREYFLLGQPEYKATEDEKKIISDANKRKKTISYTVGHETIKYIPVDLMDENYASDPSIIVELRTTDKALEDELRNLAVFHIALLLLLILGIVTGVYIMSQRIAGPVSRLVKHVSSIADGESPEPVKLNSNKEFMQLEDSINEMSRQIKKNTDELVDRNKKLEEEITLRKETEKSLVESNRQLLQSQKMEAIGLLAGGMAHDFNNMLGVIMGAAELARLEIDDDSPAIEELESINFAVKRAKDLSQKLLTFSRKDKLEVHGYSIRKIVDDLLGMLKHTLPKNIDLNTIVTDESVLSCDLNQIQQMLVNVCNNAVDSMPNGGTLTIEAGEVSLSDDGTCKECGKPLDGRYCLIKLSDTGVGIPREILPRITEPFFTTKEAGKGTGLGLSVTYGIILSHNGHLHIYSEPDKGTSIKIYLPIDKGNVRKHESMVDQKALIGTETILVVDDEEVLLKIAGKILIKNGYVPLLATNGASAIETYKTYKNNIAVVVLDLMMPGMHGSEVNRHLKELNPDVKIIYSSGFSANGMAEGLMKEKFRKFVQKPFEMITLCGAIRELLDRPEDS